MIEIVSNEVTNMRSFEFARKVVNHEVLRDNDENEVKAYPDAKLPEYATSYSAGADFFCAEEVTIPSFWSNFLHIFKQDTSGFKFLDLISFKRDSTVVTDIEEVNKVNKLFSPTLVHTGIKSCMNEDEVLELYNRSSNPKKLGLILANSVGVVDADYYNNPDNDGEIMFAFYNFKPWSVTLKVGDRIGQGVFKKFLRPEKGLVVNSTSRTGGFGSTGK